MRMEMTVRDLINNPPGPNSRQVAARYTIRDALRAKFAAAMQDPVRRRKFGVRVSRRGEGYVVWVKVPSEKYDLTYDVILQLSFPEGARAVASADVKVYCNSPSWVYVQGYVFNKNGFLADGWAHALGRAATEPPDTLNASQDIGFDKVVHQGVLFATGPGGLVTQADLQRAAGDAVPDPKDPKLSAEAKLFEYSRARDKYAAAARIVKRAERATKEEEAKRKRADARGARNAAKMAKSAGTAKVARQAGKTTRKKVSR